MITVDSDSLLTAWDIPTWHPWWMVRDDRARGIRCVAIADNAPVVAIGSGDGRVCVFNVEDGTRMVGGKGHEGGIRVLSFSGGGGLLASAGSDTTAVIWRVQNGNVGMGDMAKAPG
jgi:WD40 repeat protein